MSKKVSLTLCCLLVLCVGLVYAHDSSELETPQEGVIKVHDAENGSECSAQVSALEAPAWMTSCGAVDSTADGNGVVLAIESPSLLDPGQCDDCVGGCQYSCSGHAECMSQCPYGLGSCTQSGKCLCACDC